MRKALAALFAVIGLLFLAPAGLASAQEDHDTGGEGEHNELTTQEGEGGTGSAGETGETGPDETGDEGGEDHEISHAAEECIHILEDGGEPDDCQEAPSPILPERSELVWGIISFVTVFGLLARFAYPAIKKSMADRTERIRNSLDEADRAKTEAQQLLDDYQRQLADARNEANRIIEEARQSADQVRQDLIQRAEADAAELRQRSQADIEAAKNRAIGDLRAQVSELAIAAAEKVVERNLDRDTNMALIDSYIEQMAAGDGRQN
jgi:F-type H+-transporting ATPase subunit b